MYTFGAVNSKENHTLIYPVSKLELSLSKNEIYQGNLTFQVKPACEISGFLYASHYRMQCEREEFTGESVELAYTFDATGLEEGDTVCGEFYLITNIGEYTLPFEITIVKETIDSEVGPIRNLFHFVNLARTNWKKAVEVFYRPEFKEIFVGSDKQYKSVYRGLCNRTNSESQVEEFLILIRKKQPVSYTLEEKEIHIKGIEKTKGAIHILRNNWGYTRLTLSTDAPFLQLEKKELTEEDFISGRADVIYRVDASNLHAGKNYGRILVENGLEHFECQILIEQGSGFVKRTSDAQKTKQLVLQMMEEYIHYHIDENEEGWFDEAEKLMERITSLNGRNVQARLYQAEVLFGKKHDNEARWILRHVDEMIKKQFHDMDQDDTEETAQITAHRLYLECMYGTDVEDKESLVKRIDEIYNKYPDNLNCLRYLIQAEQEMESDEVRKLQMFRDIFCRGNRSPVLYLQAYLIYRKTPSYLDELEGLGLQVLFFAAKYHILTKELIGRVNNLAAREKKMTKTLYHLLCMCYEWDETNDTLQTICTLLIKSEKTETEYFEWYERAVAEELRITRLYEYYLLSIDLTKKELLPKMVLMYFAYHCDLDYVHTAYLYANVRSHAEEIPEIYSNYEEQIGHFVFNQVNQGHINDDLAYLYKKVICEQMVDEGFAKALIRIIFMQKITVAEPSVKYVVLIEENRCKEQKFPLNGGNAYFPVYDEEYAILLENAEGERFAVSIPYEQQEMLVKQRFWDMVEEFAEDNEGACLYFCRNHTELAGLNERQREFFVQLYKSEAFLSSYRRMIGMELMQYYFDYDNTTSLDRFLEEIAVGKLQRDERALVIKLLVLRDMNDKAYNSIITYGFEGVSVKQMIQLFHYGVGKFGNVKNSQLLAIANYIFECGKYDEKVLTYLTAYFEGNMRKMRAIWEVAVEKKLPAGDLAERIIAQSLFSGAYVARRQTIFRYYYEKGANQKLVLEYLSQCAYQYFVKEQVMDENVFAIMLETPKLPCICKIAVVYFFAQDPMGMSRQETDLVCRFIKELLAEHIYFPFFNCFAKYVPVLLPMAEKTFIVYRSSHEAKVILHYVTGDSGEESEYRKEEMREIYEGYYCESFVLFFGEKLQYYITEIEDGVETLTQSGAIEKSDALDITAESRFNLLNQMVMSQNLNEQESVRDMAMDYARQSYVTDKLFVIR